MTPVLQQQDPKRRKRGLWSILRVPSNFTPNASVPAQPSSLKLDRVYADGQDVGKLVGAVMELENAAGGSGASIVKYAMRPKVGGENRIVVLKEIVQPGTICTGNEQIIWEHIESTKATSEDASNAFVLAYLGMVRHEVTKSDVRHFIVTPWMANGSLASALENAMIDTPVRIKTWLYQILRGLRFLHDRNIVHGDFKADNILVTNSYDVVIADFGLSRLEASTFAEGLAGLNETHPSCRTAGSILYRSAETSAGKAIMALPGGPRLPPYRQSNLTLKSSIAPMSKKKPNDIWGLGMIILYMFSRRSPWTEIKDAQTIYYRIAEGQLPKYPNVKTTRDCYLAYSRGLDLELWALVHDCWERLPSRRPTVTKLIEAYEKWPRPCLLHGQLIDIEQAVHREIIDMTSELSNFDSRTPLPAHGPKQYIRLRGRWRPSEWGLSVQVVLTRCDDESTLNKNGWSLDLLNEVIRWRRTSHWNLLPLLGICNVDGIWYAVSPCWDLGCRQWVRQQDADESTLGSEGRDAPLLKLIYDIIGALTFLHVQNPPIVHGNVHIDNVFIPPYRSLEAEDLTVGACLANFQSVQSVDGEERNNLLHRDIYDFGAFFREVLQNRCRFPADELVPDAKGPEEIRNYINVYNCCRRSPPTTTMMQLEDIFGGTDGYINQSLPKIRLDQ